MASGIDPLLGEAESGASHRAATSGVSLRQPTAHCARKKKRRGRPPSQIVDGTKRCSKCREWKPLGEFHRERKAKTGRRSDCQRCYHARNRLSEYGVTVQQFDRLYEDRKGKCDICGVPMSWSGINLDHEHGTGVVRGLLCNRCNKVLGVIHDDVKWLKSAQHYLNSPPPVLL